MGSPSPTPPWGPTVTSLTWNAQLSGNSRGLQSCGQDTCADPMKHKGVPAHLTGWTEEEEEGAPHLGLATAYWWGAEANPAFQRQGKAGFAFCTELPSYFTYLFKSLLLILEEERERKKNINLLFCSVGWTASPGREQEGDAPHPLTQQTWAWSGNSAGGSNTTTTPC